MSAQLRNFTGSRIFWPVVILVGLVIVDVIAFPGFLDITVKEGHLFGAPIDILRNGAPTLLIGVGMTLVIATRGIDLSVGSIAAISGAVVSALLLNSPTPDNPWTVVQAVGIALILGFILGVWNGTLVAYLKIQPIIATLILMTAGRGVAMLITEGQILTLHSKPFEWFGSGFIVGFPVAVVIAAVVLILTMLVVRRSALGMFIESVGINPEASRQAGIRSRGLLLGIYAFCALLAALAGLIITSDQTAADANNTGLFIELDAILAVVIGGTSLMGGRFSLIGTLVGVLVIQTLVTTVYIVGIPPVATMVFKAVVVIAVSLLQSPTTNEKFANWRKDRRRPTPTKAIEPKREKVSA
ncbi:ABC transporter permease [Demequina aurantiaca]|uniref:ABC transporter permease n=1 Tax=Demequina aurantiaca TaxID=676200 RepID=UPI00078284CC|nr:ABC transporter permease [Demequina aurantiaca]